MEPYILKKHIFLTVPTSETEKCVPCTNCANVPTESCRLCTETG